MKITAKFLLYGIIFLSIGVPSLLQGSFSAWWGAGLSFNMALILASSFIIISLFFLFNFTIWLRKHKKGLSRSDNKRIAMVVKIWLLMILLVVLLKTFQVDALPSFVYLIIIIAYIVYSDSVLSIVNNNVENDEDISTIKLK